MRRCGIAKLFCGGARIARSQAEPTRSSNGPKGSSRRYHTRLTAYNYFFLSRPERRTFPFNSFIFVANIQYTMSSSSYHQDALYLSRPQEASFMTPAAGSPVFHFPEDQPPPLKVPLKNHSQAPECNENLDIMLPVIPDNFDDEELFSSRGEGVKRSIGLPIRLSMSAAPFFGHTTCFIENSPIISQRILMPLHTSEDRRPLSLPMRRSIPHDNPVSMY
eukprot:scaffold10470_cov190-Amphora_coffeaeformis.AAC.1